MVVSFILPIFVVQKTTKTDKTMRLNVASDIHKKNTSNLLSFQQMQELNDLGLVSFKERGTHKEFFLGVEELMMMLPKTIYADNTLYCFSIWASAFGVLYAGYRKPIVKNGYADHTTLVSIGLDDVAPRIVNEYANFVDVLFALVIWVDNNHCDTLREYREKLQHAVNAM